MTQYARPISDIVVGGWTPYPSTPTTRFDKIDEDTRDDDTTYINADQNGETIVIKLGAIVDPTVHTGHELHIWFRSDGGGQGEKIDVRLIEDYEGVPVEIGAVNNQTNRSALYADINADGWQLSEAQAALITDYSNLYVEITEDSVGSGEWLRVTQVYLQAPDAGGLDLVKIIDETEQMNEGTLRPRVMVRVKDETEQANEGVVRLTGLKRWINETLQINEGVLKFKGIIKIINEMVQLRDAETVIDGGLEMWASAVDLTNWLEYMEGTSSVNRESSGVHGGVYCARLDIDASNNVALIASSIILIPGGKCKLLCWYKHSMTGKISSLLVYETAGNVFLDSNGDWQVTEQLIQLPNATVWTKFELEFTAHPSYSAYVYRLQNYTSASSSIYYDDVRLCKQTMRLKSMVRLIAETLEINEGILRVRDLVRVINEMEQLNEGILRVRKLLRMINETESINEGVVRLTTLLKMIDETVQSNEGILKVLGFIRVINETEQVNEGIVRLSGLLRWIDETLELNEGILRIRDLVRIITETLQLGEGILNPRVMARIVDEMEGINESVVRLTTLLRIIDETVQLNEGILKVLGFIRVINETMQINEGVVRLTGLLRVISETLQLNEGILRARKLIRMISETLQLNEGILRARKLIRTISEALNIQENVLRARTLIRLISESISLVEGISLRKAMVRIINETAQITETTVKKLVEDVVNEIIKVIDETVSISEGALKYVRELFAYFHVLRKRARTHLLSLRKRFLKLRK